jgi:hypothetical protein
MFLAVQGQYTIMPLLHAQDLEWNCYFKNFFLFSTQAEKPTHKQKQLIFIWHLINAISYAKSKSYIFFPLSLCKEKKN